MISEFKKSKGVNAEATFNKVVNIFHETWEKEASLLTYPQAVATKMQFHIEEGAKFDLSIEAWLEFARNTSISEASEKAKSMGLNVYWDCEIPRTPEGYYLVPDLLLFRVVRTTNYVPAANPDFKIRIPEKSNYYYDLIKNMVGSMLVRRAMYEMKFDKVERARIYIKKVREELPDYAIPEELGNVFK